MLVIIVSIIIVLSVLLTAFLTFSPNFAVLVNEDFMNRAETVAFYAANNFGQIAERAGDLTPAVDITGGNGVGQEPRLVFILRQRQNNAGPWQVQDSMQGDLNMPAADNIVVTIRHEFP